MIFYRIAFTLIVSGFWGFAFSYIDLLLAFAFSAFSAIFCWNISSPKVPNIYDDHNKEE